jgi:hypothetical protein
MAINTGAGKSSSTTFAIIILLEMLVTSPLFWLFAREQRAALFSSKLAA